MKTTYSLADLTKATGAKRRAVQFWAERGIIQAEALTERAGTGTHRTFSRKEAIVACLVHPFARLQMQTGQLVVIASEIRDILDIEDNYSKIEQAISGTADLLLIIATWEDGTEACMNVLDPNQPMSEFWADTGKLTDRHVRKEGAVVLTLDAGRIARSLI